MKRLLCLCLVLSMVIGLFPSVPAVAVSDMKASDACLDLIKQFEGFSGKPYRDTDGHYTIGYGTWCPSDMVQYYTQNPMTPEEAEEELRKEIVTYEDPVNKFMDRHGITFSQQQFDAVVSLIFNVGPSWLTKGDTLINALVSGATGNELINAFTIYSMSGGKRSVGHIKRRLSEANVYLNGEYNRTLPDNLGYVLYDGQGGELDGYNVQGYDSNLSPVPLTTASREGYVFKGWSLNKEGGPTIRILNSYTMNQTLYAQWELEQIWPPPLPAPPDGGLKLTVTGDNVNVRKEPALGQTVVTKLQKGDVISVTEIFENDGYTWGAIQNGWVALEFTDYDFETTLTCIHNYVLQSHEIPSCTAEGLAVYTCSKCEDRVEQILDATGHYWTGATCTAPKTCKICGITQGEPLGHSYAPATCIAPATCTVCEHTIGSAMGHSYTEPTCTAPGKCIRCGGIGADALGHQYDKIGKCTLCGSLDPTLGGTVVMVTAGKVNAREGAGLIHRVVGFVGAGEQIRVTETCQVNGELWGRFEMGWIALKHTDHKDAQPTPCAHNYKAVGKIEPTCTAEGSVLYECTLCSNRYAESVATVDHRYNVNGRCVMCSGYAPDYNTVTVRVTGSGVNLRSGAGLSYTRIGVAGVGDQLVITETKENDGYLWGKSSKGWIALKFTDYGEDGNYVCNHQYQVISRKSATCTGEGVILYSCTQCGHSYMETIPLKAHSFREADCTTPKTCSACGNTSGFALGHSYAEGKCQRCNVTDPGYSSVQKIYATVTADVLNVRATPGGTIVGKLYQGDRVEILEQQSVDGGVWGRYQGGWIYIEEYAELETVTEKGDFLFGTVTASFLIVRKAPDATQQIVGVYCQADTVVILEQKTVNGILWGRTDLGWIKMKDVK